MSCLLKCKCDLLFSLLQYKTKRVTTHQPLQTVQLWGKLPPNTSFAGRKCQKTLCFFLENVYELCIYWGNFFIEQNYYRAPVLKYIIYNFFLIIFLRKVVSSFEKIKCCRIMHLLWPPVHPHWPQRRHKMIEWHENRELQSHKLYWTKMKL